jgi:uncharacterized membrane protein
MWRLRKPLAWLFAMECFLFALVVWIIHVPPRQGQPFIDGGDSSSLLTTIEVCTFYAVITSILGIASWMIRKEKASSRLWGVAASLTNLFLYLQPLYWYQIGRQGVWVHWAICLLGLIAFFAPQPEAHGTADQPDGKVPSGGVCYAFGILFPLAYLLTVRRDKQNAFLRFHCIQCVLLFLFWTPFLIYTDMSPAKHISTIIILLFLLSFLASWIQAHRRRQFRLPIIGSIAARLS